MTKTTCPKNYHVQNFSCPKNHMPQKFPCPKPHVQKKIPMTKITCPKNSHDQNHMSKIPMPKITCPKNFPWPKPHDQKFPMTKKEKKNPMTKSTCPKNSHVPKKVNVPQKKKKKKKKWPTKFYHNQNFWHVHTQLPKFSHNHAIKKIPTLTMSMYNRKNSYISKIITTQIFHDPTLHTQQKYFCSQNTISTKNFPYSYRKNFAINYTCQQIFHIYHDFVQPSLHNKFFMTSMPSDRPKMNWPLVIN